MQWQNVVVFVGSAMEDLTVGDFHQPMSFIDEMNDNDRGDTASVCSSLSAGLASSKLPRLSLYYTKSWQINLR